MRRHEIDFRLHNILSAELQQRDIFLKNKHSQLFIPSPRLVPDQVPVSHRYGPVRRLPQHLVLT